MNTFKKILFVADLVLFGLLVAFKASGTYDISWWVMLSPLWFPPVYIVGMVLTLVGFVVACMLLALALMPIVICLYFIFVMISGFLSGVLTNMKSK